MRYVAVDRAGHNNREIVLLWYVATVLWSMPSAFKCTKCNGDIATSY